MTASSCVNMAGRLKKKFASENSVIRGGTFVAIEGLASSDVFRG